LWCKNKSISTFLERRRFLKSLTIYPAIENIRSDSADVAEAVWYRHASFESNGQWPFQGILPIPIDDCIRIYWNFWFIEIFRDVVDC
jgi:hypothetical protein